MKTIKLLSFAAAFLGLFFFCSLSFASQGKGSSVEIVITNTTTRTQIDSMQKALSAQGITLDIESGLWSSSGQARRIAGTVTFADAKQVSFSNDNLGSVTITRKGKTTKVICKDAEGKVIAPPGQEKKPEEKKPENKGGK